MESQVHRKNAVPAQLAAGSIVRTMPPTPGSRSMEYPSTARQKERYAAHMHSGEHAPRRLSDASDDAGDTEDEHEPAAHHHRKTSGSTDHAVSDRYGGESTHTEAPGGEKRRRTHEKDETTEDLTKDDDSATDEDSVHTKHRRCSHDDHRRNGHAKTEKNIIAKMQKEVAWMQSLLGITGGEEPRTPVHATRLHEARSLDHEEDDAEPQCQYPTSRGGHYDEDMMKTEAHTPHDLRYGDDDADPRVTHPSSRVRSEEYEVHARSRYSQQYLRMSDEEYDTMAAVGSRKPRKTERPQIYTAETSQPERVGTADTVTIQRAKLELLLEKFNSAPIAAKQAGIMCSFAKQSLATEVSSFENCCTALSDLLNNNTVRQDENRKKQ